MIVAYKGSRSNLQKRFPSGIKISINHLREACIVIAITSYMMAEPSSSVTALLDAIPNLEASLEALLEKPLTETKAALEPIDRAKINVLLAYAINDLIWGMSSLFSGFHIELYRLSYSIDSYCDVLRSRSRQSTSS